jgi:hypothetical protein
MKYVLYLFLFVSSQFCFGEEAAPYDYDKNFIKTMDMHFEELFKLFEKNQDNLSEIDRGLMIFHTHHAKNIFYYFKLRYLEPFDPQNELH